MTGESAQVTDRPKPGKLTLAEILDRLGSFDGPAEQFIAQLLSVQCSLAVAEGGAILRTGDEGQADVLAVAPPVAPGSPVPAWLTTAAQLAGRVAQSGKTEVVPLSDPADMYGQAPKRQLMLVPLRGADGALGVGAYVVGTRDAGALAAIRERLELTAGVLSLYEARLALARGRLDVARLRMAMETLAAVNEPDRFAGSGMAFCNELASRWQCNRVGLGFLKGRYVQLKALSHTEKFSRKMKLVQDFEAAMEECLDQDVEVAFPAAEDAGYICRAAGEFAQRQGPAAVCCVPLRRKGEPLAVAMLVRPADKPFTPAEIEGLRLTCDLCTARLASLYEHDRWFGARVVAKCRTGLSLLVGPKHTWVKAAVVAATCFLAFALLVKGDYKVDAPFVVEATERQVVSAPFEGVLDTVAVEPGLPVVAGQTLLATMDTAKLRLELLDLESERLGYLKEADVAERDDKLGEARISRAKAERVAVQMKLKQYDIDKGRIIAPFSGTVVEAWPKTNQRAHVDPSKVLFEIAPLCVLHAELSVPEEEIADVKLGQQGELSPAADPGHRADFTVERINPVAEVISQKNVFKVRVKLEGCDPDLRPGMQGEAKVVVEKRAYAWIWTRKPVNWLRMKLWI
jgi:hypothetical protein